MTRPTEHVCKHVRWHDGREWADCSCGWQSPERQATGTRPCLLSECTEECYKGRCRKERERIIAKRQARLAERATGTRVAERDSGTYERVARVLDRLMDDKTCNVGRRFYFTNSEIDRILDAAQGGRE